MKIYINRQNVKTAARKMQEITREVKIGRIDRSSFVVLYSVDENQDEQYSYWQ